MKENSELADLQNLLHEICANRRYRSAEEMRKALLKDIRSKPFTNWIEEADPRALEVMHDLIQKWNLKEGV